MNVKSKYFVFTLNNYTPEEEKLVQEVDCSYLIYGREVADSGTPHLQGYIEFPIRKLRTAVSNLPGFRRARLAKRNGTAKEASDYCEKDDPQPFKKGEISKPQQGKRSDLEKIAEEVINGATIREIAMAHPGQFIRYSKGIRELQAVTAPKRAKKIYDLETFPFHPINLEEGYSHILYGPSGVWKTSYCRSLYPESLFVSHMDDLLRFDPVEHEAIIFDDMNFTHLPRTAQIHLVDQDDDRSIHCRYNVAFIPAGTKKIFTTNVREIFLLDDPAIKRRVKIHHINTL